MPATDQPTIGDAVLFEFTITSAYDLLIFIGTEQPDSFFGMVVEKWIGLFVPALQLLFVLAPVPERVAESAHSDAVGV